MPAKYRFSSSRSESDYEDDDGNVYSVVETVGKGKVDRVRKLKPQKDGSSLVVIGSVDPNRIDEKQCNFKYTFFRTHYAPFQPRLFKKDTTSEYRLIVPFIPGETYSQLLESEGRVRDIELQIKLFRSLISELRLLHSRGLVYLDLKTDNVLYDKATGNSKLIDGGNAAAMNGEMPGVFQRRERELAQYRKECFHIAPECWINPETSTRLSPAPSMDVYSLGVMMLRYMFDAELDSDLSAMTALCLEQDPAKRPTLECLDFGLQGLLPRKTYRGFQSYTKVIAGDESDTLYYIIRQVAQRFLLGQKIKFNMEIPYERDRSYTLCEQSHSEQALYLELAGLTFFDYVSQDKESYLDLHFSDDVTVTLRDDVLLVKYIKENRPIINVLKIDKQACVKSFDTLVRQNEQLAGFAYNINDPIQTAQRLWKHLSAQNKRAQEDDDSSNALEQSWGCCIA